MTAIIDIKGLLDMLPSPVERRPLISRKPTGFTYVNEHYERFVSPTLVFSRAIEVGKTVGVLIEAPAAVGKSVFANELACETLAPVWDLTGEAIAGGGFTGSLGNAFGLRPAADFIDELRAGDNLLLLDALDEGRTGTGYAGFERFLGDWLGQLQGSTPSRPSLVMLGRHDAVEYVDTFIQVEELEGIRFPLARGRIDFFSYQSAVRFVDKQLIWLYDNARPRRGRLHQHERFNEVRDLVFNKIVEALRGRGVTAEAEWDAEVVKSFLGYAPVLQGLSSYFFAAGANWQALKNEWQRRDLAPGPGGVWAVLFEVLEKILEREQEEKAWERIEERLGTAASTHGFSAWSGLYQPNEQRKRLLAQAPVGVKFKPEELIPPVLKGYPEVRTDYEEVVRDLFADHPFKGEEGAEKVDGFRGSVFRDDTFAWLLSSEAEAGLRAEHDRRKEELRRYLLRSQHVDSGFPHGHVGLTPVFARGLMARCHSDVGAIRIDARDFGLLYEAILAQAHELGVAELTLSPSEDKGTVRGELLLPSNEEVLPLEVVVDGDSGLTFPHRLRNCAIDVAVPITLGVDAADFTLGPRVDVTCSEVVIASGGQVEVHTSIVSAEDEGGSVVLDADRLTSDPRPISVLGDPLRLVIRVSEAPSWEWNRYFHQKEQATACIDQFGKELCRALRYLAYHAPSVVNLEDYSIEKSIIGPVRPKLEAAEILVENMHPTQGLVRERPAVNQQVRMMLKENQNDVASGRIPEEIARRLML